MKPAGRSISRNRVGDHGFRPLHAQAGREDEVVKVRLQSLLLLGRFSTKTDVFLFRPQCRRSGLPDA